MPGSTLFFFLLGCALSLPRRGAAKTLASGAVGGSGSPEFLGAAVHSRCRRHARGQLAPSCLAAALTLAWVSPRARLASVRLAMLRRGRDEAIVTMHVLPSAMAAGEHALVSHWLHLLALRVWLGEGSVLVVTSLSATSPMAISRRQPRALLGFD